MIRITLHFPGRELVLITQTSDKVYINTDTGTLYSDPTGTYFLAPAAGDRTIAVELELVGEDEEEGS